MASISKSFKIYWMFVGKRNVLYGEGKCFLANVINGKREEKRDLCFIYFLKTTISGFLYRLVFQENLLYFYQVFSFYKPLHSTVLNWKFYFWSDVPRKEKINYFIQKNPLFYPLSEQQQRKRVWLVNASPTKHTIFVK